MRPNHLALVAAFGLTSASALPQEPFRLEGASGALRRGERGRVKVTALTKELFIPGLLLGVEATRARPIALYPWDGIADAR